jgi:branched-chain amino acid transport system substrate-binding protein
MKFMRSSLTPGARSRRRSTGIAAVIAASSLVLTGVASVTSASAATSGGTIKIGYISPRTGVYAGFADGDPYMLKVVRAYFAKGVVYGGKTYKVQILDRDSGSDPAKAGQLADQLITKDKVDLLMATSTPEVTNPVIAKCEANAVPCITTIAPWQAVVFGGGFGPDKLMKWTHHFFFGIEGFGLVDPNAWDQVVTNKKVGVLWPNDADGQAFRDPTNGYTPFAEKAGYTIVDPGAYEDGTKDFTSIITKFKQEGVDIIAGVPIPPDFVTFWTQAAQQGFHPKVVTVGKALFFPATVPSIPNNLGDGLSFATWWGPTFPYKSSLDGTTPKTWIKNFTASKEGKGLTWNQATPLNYSLFELANAAFKKAKDPKNKTAVNAAVGKLNMMTLSGQLNFVKGPFPGIATIPTVIGQWEKTSAGKWQWVVVDNKSYPAIPVARKIKPLG